MFKDRNNNSTCRETSKTKKNYICFFILLFISLISIKGYSQFDKIISDSKLFDYLIGKEYCEYSELSDFKIKSSSSISNPFSENTCIANLVIGDKQIITSEITKIDTITNKEVHLILDIIVLNGYFTICCGCLISKKKNKNVLSIYPLGYTNDDLVLVAFERNGKTGQYKKVNSNKLYRNPLKPH